MTVFSVLVRNAGLVVEQIDPFFSFSFLQGEVLLCFCASQEAAEQAPLLSLN